MTRLLNFGLPLKDIYILIISFIFPYGHSPTQLKRLFKASLSTAICFMLPCIDSVDIKLGPSSYLCALISVSMHPGRRLGAMMQSLVIGLLGILVGIPYALFAHFLVRKVYYTTNDIQKAMALYIVFEFFILLFIGYVRSAAPRIFSFAYIMFLIAHFSFLLPITTTLSSIAYDFSIPFLVGISVAFVINLAVFPEFGSTHIGTTVLSSIHELQVMFTNTSYFFINLDIDDPELAKGHTQKLAFLINQKKKVRTSLAQCSSTMLECTYEFSYSYMAPQELKPLLNNLQSLSITINALHVTCELVLGVFVGSGAQSSKNDGQKSFDFADLEKELKREASAELSDSDHSVFEDSKEFLKHVKPQKEANYADRDLLLEFIHSVREPAQDVTKVALEALNHTKCVLAYAYDAKIDDVKISSIYDTTFVDCNEKTRTEKYQVSLEKIDEYLQEIARVNENFGTAIRLELSKMSNQEFDYIYLVPREEYFVLTLFILNFREASILISKILSQVRTLLAIRINRESKGWSGRRIWFSVIRVTNNWHRFLTSGFGEPQEGETASIIAAKQSSGDFKEKDNVQVNKPSYYTRWKQKNHMMSSSLSLNTTGSLVANMKKNTKSFVSKGIRKFRKLSFNTHMFFSKRRLHFQSAFRTTLLLFLVTFPGYSEHMHEWYNTIRGSWVGFAALVALETNVGATTLGSITRTICVTIGSAWGYALYVAGNNGDDRYLMVILVMIGTAPLYYFMFYSPYGKAGMMGVVSLTTVPLSTLRNHGIGGTVLVNFAKRCIAMVVGGGAATLINVTVFPQKARTQLVDQLIYSLKYCQLIQIQLAVGLNGESLQSTTMVRSNILFNKYQKKARAALQAAESLLGVAKKEPRLKASFSTHSEIYAEIIFVLHQILDRYNNIKMLRGQYGSAVSDELSECTYLYRREVYASIVALMRTAEEALTSKRSIPQFMPSPRIAHLRVVNAVRKYLFEQAVNKSRGNGFGNEVISENIFLGAELQDDTFLGQGNNNQSGPSGLNDRRTRVQAPTRESFIMEHQMLRNKYMGWSADSGATEEIIEYVEELVDLVKFLVGYQEFKYGFLARPMYNEWKNAVREQFQREITNAKEEDVLDIVIDEEAETQDHLNQHIWQARFNVMLDNTPSRRSSFIQPGIIKRMSATFGAMNARTGDAVPPNTPAVSSFPLQDVSLTDASIPPFNVSKKRVSSLRSQPTLMDIGIKDTLSTVQTEFQDECDKGKAFMPIGEPQNGNANLVPSRQKMYTNRLSQILSSTSPTYSEFTNNALGPPLTSGSKELYISSEIKEEGRDKAASISTLGGAVSVGGGTLSPFLPYSPSSTISEFKCGGAEKSYVVAVASTASGVGDNVGEDVTTEQDSGYIDRTATFDNITEKRYEFHTTHSNIIHDGKSEDTNDADGKLDKDLTCDRNNNSRLNMLFNNLGRHRQSGLINNERDYNSSTGATSKLCSMRDSQVISFYGYPPGRGIVFGDKETTKFSRITARTSSLSESNITNANSAPNSKRNSIKRYSDSSRGPLISNYLKSNRPKSMIAGISNSYSNTNLIRTSTRPNSTALEDINPRLPILEVTTKRLLPSSSVLTSLRDTAARRHSIMAMKPQHAQPQRSFRPRSMGFDGSNTDSASGELPLTLQRITARRSQRIAGASLNRNE